MVAIYRADRCEHIIGGPCEPIVVTDYERASASRAPCPVVPMPHRCIDCGADLPHGNRCAQCERAHRLFTSERGCDLHFFTPDPRGSLWISDRQYHGDHYQP